MNIAILYLDIVSCLTIVLLSKLVFKSLRHPIFLICAWWSAFVFLSNIVVIGEGIHPGTHLVFLLFIYSILGFGILFQTHTRAAATFPIPKLLTRYRRIWIALAILIYSLTIYLGVVGYELQKVYGLQFRELTFASDRGFSLLYGSYALEVVAVFLGQPLTLFGCIAFPLVGIFYGNYKLLLLGLIFSAAADFQRSGRASLYIFVLTTSLAFIIMKRRRLWRFMMVIMVLFASIFAVAFISQQRIQADEFHVDVIERIIQEGVNYHVYGAYLFDDAFSNDKSILHQGTSFGRLSLLSYPDTIVCMALRRFGIRVAPEIDRFGEYWQTQVVLGYASNGDAIVANAFYTSLFAIFYDFGYLGVLLVPGLFVYFLVLHYKTYVRHHNITSLFVTIFLTIFFMLSIFNCKIVSNDFSVIFYCVLFLPMAGAFPRERTTKTNARQQRSLASTSPGASGCHTGN
jgi:oligosaccharide repeat unit polymerase